MHGPIIISAFPCVGKTSLQESCRANSGSYIDRHGRKFQVVDLQSTPYRRLSMGENASPTAFADSYLAAVERTAHKYDSCIILVAAQPEIRRALADKAMQYIYLYPNPSIKEQWLARIAKRRADDPMMHSIDKNWKEWVEGEERGYGFEQSRNIKTLEIREDQSLQDVIDDIIQQW